MCPRRTASRAGEDRATLWPASSVVTSSAHMAAASRSWASGGYRRSRSGWMNVRRSPGATPVHEVGTHPRFSESMRANAARSLVDRSPGGTAALPSANVAPSSERRRSSASARRWSANWCDAVANGSSPSRPATAAMCTRWTIRAPSWAAMPGEAAPPIECATSTIEPEVNSFMSLTACRTTPSIVTRLRSEGFRPRPGRSRAEDETGRSCWTSFQTAAVSPAPCTKTSVTTTATILRQRAPFRCSARQCTETDGNLGGGGGISTTGPK